MTDIKDLFHSCKTVDQFETLLEGSHRQPVFLMKHSTMCGTSSGAWKRFQEFAKSSSGDSAAFWQVLVIEDRSLSTAIARQSGIRHQSPQVILFRNGKAVWHESHWRIDTDALQEALEKTS